MLTVTATEPSETGIYLYWLLLGAGGSFAGRKAAPPRRRSDFADRQMRAGL